MDYLQAVLNGFWVVFEDIDNAPSDVQSILLPLLEGASSYSTGHGEVFTFISLSESILSAFPLLNSSLYLLRVSCS